MRALSDVERSLAPALPFPRSGFIGTIAAEIRMHEKGHIQGHRYALVDAPGAAAACASTPLGKLHTATSTTCQAALSLAWHDCQRHLTMERARRRRELRDAAESASAEAGPSQRGAASSNAAAAELGAVEDGESAADAREDSGAPHWPPEVNQSAAGVAAAPGGTTPGDEPPVRMEMLAQAPNRKWIAAKWALGGEVVHADDVATRDRNSLASAHRNIQSMLATYFPGVMGL